MRPPQAWYKRLSVEMQVCGATVWLEDAQGKKRASHTVSANLKVDGSREYRIDNKAKSGKEVKVWAGCKSIEPGFSAKWSTGSPCTSQDTELPAETTSKVTRSLARISAIWQDCCRHS